MPNKAVSGYTQVPVTAPDLRDLRFSALDEAASQFQASVSYRVRDTLGAIRAVRTLSQVVGAYPVSGAAILSAVNTAEGT